MKKFIIMFIGFIFLIALIIGQCNDNQFLLDADEESDSAQELDSKIQKQGLKSNNVEDIEDLSQVFVADSIEIPRIQRDVPEQILKRTAYTASYNTDTRCPNWVAWYLSADHSDGMWPRSNDYREDFDVPTPRATNDDYSGSPLSRGHLCPAGDNKWDSLAMSETFLLSNMCPQEKKLNNGLWNSLEMSCRKWAKKYGGVYIVCGPLYNDVENETIGENNVVVPEAFYKVILCLKGKPKAIGFVMGNNEYNKNDNKEKKKIEQYVKSVDEVENMTRIDFFPALPDDIENEVEAHANIDDWR